MHDERDYEGAFFLQIKCSNILQKARLGLKKKKLGFLIVSLMVILEVVYMGQTSLCLVFTKKRQRLEERPKTLMFDMAALHFLISM